MKPGKSSSELWLIIATGAMLLANGTDFINVPWETLETFAMISGVYAGGRSWVKTNDKKKE